MKQRGQILKTGLLCWLLLCIGSLVNVHAQKRHYIYIQNDKKEKFTATLNNKVYHSSAAGYLVIAKLKKGTYQLAVTLAGKTPASQQVQCVVQDKDLSLIVQSSATGWALADAVTRQPLTANTQPVYANTSPAPETAETGNVNAATGKGIVKTAEQRSAIGVDQVYIDYTTDKPDTVKAFVPDYVAPAKNTPAANTGKVSYNTNCLALAVESDYNRVRRAMSSETSDDKMIQAAADNYKNRCYTTEQIRKLGFLFVSEQSRCNFFIAAKPHIYDLLAYASLESLFTSPAILEQFRKSAR
jgi:hypothetical protein